MDYLHILVAARLAKFELQAADAAMEASHEHPLRYVLIRSLLVAITNVADLELTARALYKAHPELGELATPHRKAFEFAKYLRNHTVGHLHPAVSAKAVEWRPELNEVLKGQDINSLTFVAMAVLETAINTFVNETGHRFFDTETDLVYPPDNTRFLNFLGATAHAAMAYVESLATVAAGAADLPDWQENLMALAKKAGGTTFKFITKKGEA